MLHATEQETQDVADYMASQAPGLRVDMTQKVYSENVLDVVHDVWDVHTDKDRWWVITSPMNLYSQTQFPNLDLALTFHVGLCLRIPRRDRTTVEALAVEPFAETCRYIQEANIALGQAQEVADYQAIGVRCREALLAFTSSAQVVVPWVSESTPPKRADLKAWVDFLCTVMLPGRSHEDRRHLIKASLESAWKFANWLTHAKGSHWQDAEAAISALENAVGLAISMTIRHIRGVPDHCPACGSHRLSPERGYRSDDPETEWERPTCTKCGWAGEPTRIKQVPGAPAQVREPLEGECVIPTEPLRALIRPQRTE